MNAITSSLSSLFKKATNLIGFSSEEINNQFLKSTVPLNGEIVYCKNNVCVHPPGSGDDDHYPGYLTVKCQDDSVLGKTLVLTWVPNNRLRKKDGTASNGTSNSPSLMTLSSPSISVQALSLSVDESSTVTSDDHELSTRSVQSPTGKSDSGLSTLDRDAGSLNHHVTSESSLASHGNHSADSDAVSSNCTPPNATENGSVVRAKPADYDTHGLKLLPVADGDPLPALKANAEENDAASSSTGGPDSRPVSDVDESELGSEFAAVHTIGRSSSGDRELGGSSQTGGPITAESLVHDYDVRTRAFSHIAQVERAAAAENGEPRSPSVFIVDLGMMVYVRFFFVDERRTSGQLVIVSRESQFKLLHFHHGGLDRLDELFESWKFFVESKAGSAQAQRQSQSDPARFGSRPRPPTSVSDERSYKQYTIVRPNIVRTETHPDEDKFGTVTEEIWNSFVNERGQIDDDCQLRKAIFFGGLDARIRARCWPFLLKYFAFDSTFEERDSLRNARYLEYQQLRVGRDTMSNAEREAFQKTVQCTVEKDVVRTDRSNPFFRGDDNPNVELLKTILLNYAFAHPSHGYTQGMSDLLAPLLTELRNEVDTYWCFVGLMQRTIFVSSPHDTDIEKQLNYLRELLRVLLPRFYRHLLSVPDGLDMLFAHRWLLLCFKREFADTQVLRIWEACWSHYQTDYFHLFVALAIIQIYGASVIEQTMTADDMLFYFSNLSMHMQAELVLRQARFLLHRFRTLSRIPCTLANICRLCGTGMWDSCYSPTIFCIGHLNAPVCPYQLQSVTSSNYVGVDAASNAKLPSSISR